MRLNSLFRPSSREIAAGKLYKTLVEAARHPWFYLHGGVPDSVDGRFDMIALHAWMVMERLSAEDPGGPRLAQALFDLMFRDLDRSLREMGVGDLGVPRRIKAMIAAFYGRAKAYRDDALDQALARNLYRSAPPEDEVIAKIVAYISTARESLRGQALIEGEVRFPAPVP